jgi:Fe-S-cluster containining protein
MDKPRNRPTTAASQTFTTKYEEKCAACCKTIADTFYELLTALGQLARLDPAVKEKCSKDASRLAENMVERLKEWPPVIKTNMTTVETYATHERW